MDLGVGIRAVSEPLGFISSVAAENMTCETELKQMWHVKNRKKKKEKKTQFLQ